MTLLSRHPASQARPGSAPSAASRPSHPYPSCVLPARPPRNDKAQLPLTWEDLLGRR
jgi:hypothetical protein